MYTDTNIIGERGEMLATALLMTGEVFSARLLGGKVEAFDVYAEVYDTSCPYPLLLQVKTTTMSDRYNNSSIKTPVDDVTIRRLAAKPIPTYVAGFDMIDNVMYLAPVFSGAEQYPSIPLNHKLDLNHPGIAVAVLQQLKKDVIRYYDSINIKNNKSTYVSLL